MARQSKVQLLATLLHDCTVFIAYIQISLCDSSGVPDAFLLLLVIRKNKIQLRRVRENTPFQH